jgi:molybdopterin-synthase adenylyltransferase
MKKLKDLIGKKILIVGAGSTGCQVLTRLASLKASLIVVDRDVIEPVNLDRQVLYSKKDIGKPKAEVAAKKLSTKTKIKFLFDDLDSSNISKIITDVDLIFECTDNIDARLLLNDYCAKNHISWIHTSAERSIGEVMLITPDSACYQCVIGEKHGDGCDTHGVDLKILEKTASSAVQIGKEHLSGINLTGLHRITPSGQQNFIVKKNKKCLACKGNYIYLEGRARNIGKLCGHNRYFLDLKKELNLKEIANKIKGHKILTKDSLIASEFTIMRTGKILISASTQTEARKKFAKILSI